MAEMMLEGVNGTLTLDNDKIIIERRPGVSLSDYVGDPKLEFTISELSRLDYKKPGLLGGGYFRFIFKGEDIPEVAVPVHKLAGDRHTLIIKAFNPTNMEDANKIYNKIQEQILGHKQA